MTTRPVVGEVSISAAFGDQTSLQALISRETLDGPVTLDYVGLIDSRRIELQPGSNDVLLENYLTDAAARTPLAAPNVMIELLEGEAPVESATVLADSGLFSTSAKREQLSLGVPHAIQVQQGSEFELPASVRRLGERRDHAATVAVHVPPGVHFSDNVLSAPSIGRERQFIFHGRADEVGHYDIVVSLVGGYNDATAPVRIDVVDRGRQRWLLWVGPAVLAGIAALVYVARRTA